MFTKSRHECSADTRRRALEQSLIDFLDGVEDDGLPPLPPLDDDYAERR